MEILFEQAKTRLINKIVNKIKNDEDITIDEFNFLYEHYESENISNDTQVIHLIFE